MKININNGLAIFIVAASCLQLDYVFFNVPFFLPLIAVTIGFIWVLFAKKFAISSAINLIGLLALLLLVTLVSDDQKTGESIRKGLIYYGYVGFSIFTIFELLKNIERVQLEKLFKVIISLSLLVVACETVLRFSLPTLDLRSDNAQQLESKLNLEPTILDFVFDNYFYIYKQSSVMFFDSNFVAIFLLAIIVIHLYYINEIKSSGLMFASLIFNISLILFTFSRAGIVTTALLMILNFYKLQLKKYKVFLSFTVAFSLLLTPMLIYIIGGASVEDGSLISKMEIFKSLSSLFDKSFINILFGFGVHDGATVYSYDVGKYAHALIPLLLGQFGLIGLGVYFYLLIRLTVHAGLYGWILLFAILLNGLSLADPLQIMVYIAFILMGRHAKTNAKIKIENSVY